MTPTIAQQPPPPSGFAPSPIAAASTIKSFIKVPMSPLFSGECPPPLTAADLHSLLEASQALSRETVLGDLLKTLMPIALCRTGSTFGMLLLPRGEHLSAAARAWARPDQLDVCLTEIRPCVEQAPLALLDATLRERRTILHGCTHDADLCAGDTYLRHRKPRSAICTPLLKQGVPIALLYLENAVLAGVFTGRRVAYIEMLAAQAAISLDHAQLYQQLQTEKALRRQAESTLRISKESLAIIERLNHTFTWRWELDTDEVSCCSELTRLLDLPSHRCRSDALFGSVHPDDRMQVESDIYEALFDGRWVEQEYRILVGGAVHHLQCVGRIERGTSGRLAFVGTAIDVSKRKQADDALRAVKSELARVSRISTMGEFAASIAHEVNQPLAAIAMNASAGLNWLKWDPPQLNQVHNALSRILRASTDAEGLIRSMNNMARKSGPELRRFTVDDAIGEVLLLLRADLHKHRIEVCTDFTLAQHQLLADRVQFQQVMMNLFLNAIDAMRSVSCRTRVLEVRSAMADASGTLCISVEDNGSGIDASVAERLFDPLFSTKPAGMGMGLSICRSIVEAHGGRIWSCPRRPHGAAFHVSLPATDPQNV